MRGFDFDKALVALQNELHCFAYKLTADKDEAENLLQETMSVSYTHLMPCKPTEAIRRKIQHGVSKNTFHGVMI